MRSQARALLAELTKERGTDGTLRLNTAEGPDLPPGSMAYPPCQCPQHRPSGLTDKVRAVNARSGGQSS